MIAVAGGILIVCALIFGASRGFDMLDTSPGWGWALLAAVGIVVLFVIF